MRPIPPCLVSGILASIVKDHTAITADDTASKLPIAWPPEAHAGFFNEVWGK